MKPVVVFGATGYTGKLIVPALLAIGVTDVILGGRDAERLRRLADQYGGLQTRVADVDRPETLSALLDGAHVVIDAVGPFLRFGEPVVRAAIARGVHFLDITAEQSYMTRILETYDRAAREKGVVVINAQGLEFAAGICAASLLAESDPSIETIDIFTRVDNHGWSRGSAKSSLDAIFQPQLVRRDGQVAARGAWPLPRGVAMPDRNRREYAIPFPGAEALHFGRAHPQVRHVTNSLIMPTPQAVAAMGIVSLTPLLKLLLRPGLVATLRRRIDSGPEGPSADARHAQTFNILARGVTRSGALKGVMVSGADAYGATAIISALGAKLLVDGDPRTVGVVSTPDAFGADAFLNGLASSGITTSRPALHA
jgi:short subunit dehydrogenase-like uncharacterized protein